MMILSTSELTTLPDAAPMITPTARSRKFPLTANSLNSEMSPMRDVLSGWRGERDRNGERAIPTLLDLGERGRLNRLQHAVGDGIGERLLHDLRALDLPFEVHGDLDLHRALE